MYLHKGAYLLLIHHIVCTPFKDTHDVKTRLKEKKTYHIKAIIDIFFKPGILSLAFQFDFFLKENQITTLAAVSYRNVFRAWILVL